MLSLTNQTLVHDIFEHQMNFLIEGGRPVLEQTTIDYIILAEDMAMKTGPLLSPRLYKEFIYPRLKKVVEFYKSHGTRYVGVDTDGNPEALIPMLMDAGVDFLWPLERAADQDPVRLRKKFGRALVIWGGVDKRALARGKEAIDAHLREFIPLIKEGGFIPTIDHTVPPDISWENFQYYMQQKDKLLTGNFVTVAKVARLDRRNIVVPAAVVGCRDHLVCFYAHHNGYPRKFCDHG